MHLYRMFRFCRKSVKTFLPLSLLVCAFFNPIYAAGAPCFSYEVYEHVNVPGGQPALTNSATTNYPDEQRRLNHPVILADPVPVQVRLGRFTAIPPAPWDVHLPLAGPPLPMNLPNINRMITRRLAHGVLISPALLANLGAANALGVITPALTASLRAGGYFNDMSSIINRLTLGLFPLGTIFGVPLAFIPDSVLLHIALPQRVSKNLNELSHSSLSSPIPGAPIVPGGLTIKDMINGPYVLLGGIALPESATIVSSNRLQ